MEVMLSMCLKLPACDDYHLTKYSLLVVTKIFCYSMGITAKMLKGHYP